MTTANVEINKLICKLYFEEDLSSYAIAEKIQQVTGRRFYAPNVFRILSRDARKYGYIYPKA